MGIKDFFIKKAIQSQIKNLPKDQQDVILKALEENPEIFVKIAEEVKALTKQGKNQMTAMMEVMKKHQAELQQIFGAQGRGGAPQKRRPF